MEHIKKNLKLIKDKKWVKILTYDKQLEMRIRDGQ